MSTLTQKPVIASVLSLLAATFMTLWNSVFCAWSTVFCDVDWMENMMGRWMRNMHLWRMESFALPLAVIGVVLGIMIIVSAIMLYVNAERHAIWSALVLIFSVSSILSCMGGLGVGLLLGVVGGTLAILWMPGKL